MTIHALQVTKKFIVKPTTYWWWIYYDEENWQSVLDSQPVSYPYAKHKMIKIV